MKSKKAMEKLEKIRAVTQPYLIVRGGMQPTVLPSVYPTSELSEILVETMNMPEINVRPGTKLLDYGCGTGFLGIHGAQRGASVTCTDVNPAAIECAKANARSLLPENEIRWRCGRNLICLEPQDGPFDVIYAGMPWDNDQPIDMLS